MMYGAGLALVLAVLAGDGPAAAPESRLVCLAPRRPVLLTVQVQIDGVPLAQVRQAYVTTLFRSLDRDGNGRLDAEEAQRIAALTGDSSLSADELPDGLKDANGGIPRDDFYRAVLGRMGPPLEIGFKELTATQRVSLLGPLDRNGDGRLSRGELEAARQSLRKLDLDQDETFGADELIPYVDPYQSNGRTMPASKTDEPPFRLVPEAGSSDEIDLGSLAEIVTELRQHYARAGESAGGLTRDELQLESAAFQTFDRNGDGRLDEDELATYLHQGTPDVRLVIELPGRQPVRPKVKLIPGDAPPPERVAQPRSSELALTLAGVELGVRARVPRITSYDARQFYRLEFRKADTDGNKYLGEGEFAALQLPGADFAAVDADGDGMVFEKELVAHLNRQAEQSRHRVALTVAREGQSLFELFDTNSDRRLSPRELRQAAERIDQLDVSGDGHLTEGELAGRYDLAFHPGTTDLPESAMTAPAGGDMPAPPSRLGGTTGPEWFRRMDYNRDGDLTPREFLGPLDDFRKLDTNADGLIDAEEAQSATS